MKALGLEIGADATLKYSLVADALGNRGGSVLDVGCRDGILRNFLPAGASYLGVDVVAHSAVGQICDVEKGLPFPDRSFDTVIGLDVLEHTDRLHNVFADFMRVAREKVIIQLPNLYHWTCRLNYLAGKYPDKYKFSAVAPTDRHKWMMSYQQTAQFALDMAKNYGVQASISPLSFGRRFVPIDIILAVFSLNLAARSALVIFDKKAQGNQRPGGKPLAPCGS